MSKIFGSLVGQRLLSFFLLILVISAGILGSMAQAQPNPQVNAMCANIAARMYPLGIQSMPNVQVAHEEGISRGSQPWSEEE